MDNKEKGRIGLITAISYFGLNGYTINIPLNDTQWYDLVVEKDGILKTVQCKCTTTLDNDISLRNTGGTNGYCFYFSNYKQIVKNCKTLYKVDKVWYITKVCKTQTRFTDKKATYMLCFTDRLLKFDEIIYEVKNYVERTEDTGYRS